MRFLKATSVNGNKEIKRECKINGKWLNFYCCSEEKDAYDDWDKIKLKYIGCSYHRRYNNVDQGESKELNHYWIKTK